ncbi:nucleotidyltransferase domain-containing protein [Nonomuraea sp. NPDC049725]|uniref:nucleotidyltransferase domain-containing protein n=1 Tax=Nonomuraea sp. NPDC049725 TaxID=3154508 RepID=UPI00343675D2
MVSIYDSDIATVIYRPAGPGTGVAYLGYTPCTYFEDPEASVPTDVEREAVGLASWWSQAHGGADDAEHGEDFVEVEAARFLGALSVLAPALSPREIASAGNKHVAFVSAKLTDVKRDRGTRLIEVALTSQVAGQNSWPLEVVDKIYVFGSYARGALEPGDVDLFIDRVRGNQRWAGHFVRAMSNGRNPYSIIRQGLLGSKRGCQLVIDYDIHADSDAILLWQRGEGLDIALERLRAIKADPLAGRAPREAMLPEFEGLDDHIPLYQRERLLAAVNAGAISIERITLNDAGPDLDPHVERHIRFRWKDGSPLRRTARAVVAHWRGRGIDPATAHLHGVTSKRRRRRTSRDSS